MTNPNCRSDLERPADVNTPVTLSDLSTLTEVLDRMGRRWVKDGPLRMFHQGDISMYLSYDGLHKLLGPLSRVPQPVTIWRAKHDDLVPYWRFRDGVVEFSSTYSNGTVWANETDDSVMEARIIAAPAENREPPSELAERVEGEG